MKRYNSILAIATVVTLIMGFMIPATFAAPASTTAAMMEWTPVGTPDMTKSQVDNILSPANASGTLMGSEIIKLLVGSNGSRMFAIVRVGYWDHPAPIGISTIGNLVLMQSFDGGRTWNPGAHMNLTRDLNGGSLPPATGWAAARDAMVFDVAIAPDDANVVVAACAPALANPMVAINWTQQVWITTDGGTFWQNTNWPPATVVAGTDLISALDISMNFGDGRFVLVGTRPGTGALTHNIQTMRVPGYGGWAIQDNGAAPHANSANPFIGDVIAAKFSPTFIGDSTIVVVYADATATYALTGAMDIFSNRVDWSTSPIELKNSSATAGTSPSYAEIWGASIALPSDFSGQTASLRRIYVSTAATANPVINHGIYRIDDTVVYTLMDNTNIVNKQIYSIAYWGTYASGKLMAGEHFGYECTATVPTWFTDSPTVCPVPCWYPAKKPVTGAAGMAACTANLRQFGNAFVAWSPTYADQGVAYAVTGAENWGVFTSPATAPIAAATPSAAQIVGQWPNGIFSVPVPLDESAFALTRNNGATWNELGMIDTLIAKLTDFAISPDCTTAYLASVNNQNGCAGFDSVWRSSNNEKVVAPPLPALPVGSYWERVLTHVTAITCNLTQSDYAILRLAQDKTDGQVVFWAAGGTSTQSTIWSRCSGAPTYDLSFTVRDNTKAVEWSPDFGDFWGDIRPRLDVQDMAAPSSTVLYVVDNGASTQKLPYTGTAWSSASATVGAAMQGAHTIEAMGANDVLVGGSSGSSWVAAYSSDAGLHFAPFSAAPPFAPMYGYHLIFDTDFATTKTVYVGNDANNGNIGRNKVDTMAVPFTNMMNFCGGHAVGYFGLAQTNSKNVSNQGTLYGAHRPKYCIGTDSVGLPGTPLKWTPAGCVASITDCQAIYWSGVERTLRPLDGIPKPCVEWDCLDQSTGPFRTAYPYFTLEPKSLKLCGCLTQDTNATLYAIDNDTYSGNHQVFFNNVFSNEPQVWSVNSGGFNNAGINGLIVGNSNLGDRGRLWSYTDCVAKTGPKLTMADNTIIGCDPATGRNQEVNFTWEQLCIATTYEVHIDKAKAMNLPVFSGFILPYDVTSPSMIYLAGGEGIGGSYVTTDLSAVWSTTVSAGTTSTMVAVPSLECGHTYYWKVRVRDEVTMDMVRSPWSDIRAFTIKAGFKVTTPYYGPQLLAPDNGCGCACAAPVSFSWSPFKETTGYKFELSTNADMSSPIVSTTVKNATAYQWTGTPKCNTSYFWRVMATDPAPSEWSATFSFQTQAAPPAPPVEKPDPGTPLWVWVIIGIGSILVIVTLVLIFKTRRV